jgi:divalent metal cation (Fe/Co/Zn/Cd) transporter
LITGLAAVAIYSSGSHTAVFPLLFATGGLLCLFLMLFTMKAAALGDAHRYPYGTGRLENVSAILLSVVISVGTMLPFVQALVALLSGHSHDVSMGWTFVLLLVATLGNASHSFHARALRKAGDNPILTSLYHGYHAGVVRDGCSCAVIGLCWLFNKGDLSFMARLDQLATIILSIYSLYCFLPQIWINFRALADFPLTEEAQLKVMGLLARHFDAYELPGRIYTTNRGNVPVFEVELAFNSDMSVGDLIALEQTMRADFQQGFPGCVFRIIPQALA